MKPNIRLEYHFHYLKIIAWLVIQNIVFKKKIIKLYSQSYYKNKNKNKKPDKIDASHNLLSWEDYYSSSPTKCTKMTLHRLTDATPMASNNPPTNYHDNLVRLSLRTIHRMCDIRHLLDLKIPCKSHISKIVSQTRHNSLISIFLKNMSINRIEF